MDKLAGGLVDLIDEMGQTNILAFGMLPAPLMGEVERGIRERVIGEVAGRLGVSPADALPHIDRVWIDSLVSEATHAVSVAVIGEASRRGILLV